MEILTRGGWREGIYQEANHVIHNVLSPALILYITNAEYYFGLGD